MHRNSYLWTSDENSDTGIRFLDPDLFIGNDISAIWRGLLLIFALNMLNVHHTSTSSLVDYWPKKCVTCFVSPTMKISTKFEVYITFHCLVIAFVLLICYVTLWPWALSYFDLGHWSDMVDHVAISPPSLTILWLSICELWLLTSPIGYCRQCVCNHCTCTI